MANTRTSVAPGRPRATDYGGPVISSARLPRLLAAGCVVLGLFAAACSDDGGSESTSEAPGTTTAVLETTTTQSVDTSTTVAPNTTAEVQQPLECTAATARACLLPWPNDAFTVADPSTATGRRLSIPADATPRNAAGAAIDVTDQNRADGFSPGSAVLVDLPGLDPVASGLAPSTDIGASLADDAPIRITDTVTGERWPYFAELDAQAADDADRLLMIHPAVSLTEGHTYEVSIGDLVDVNGDPLVAPLSRWTFTVASADSLSGRVRAMRDDAYASLVDAPPSFAVTDIADRDGLRIVDGTIDVPNYLSGDGSPGATMLLDDNGSPVRSTTSPTYPARFRCVLPTAPAAPVPVIVYGHGLLGDRGEVEALSFAASIGVAGACATDWIGMTTDDIGNVAAILADVSMFPQQADRMQQGLLNFQFLGRALNDERAFAADPAFQSATGAPIIAPGATQFVGNSQGGILGGAASAISTEWQRVVLGVPGINYSLLLHRSSDWPQFQAVFDTAYANPVDRVLALQLIQLLWDRGENNGYAQHHRHLPRYRRQAGAAGRGLRRPPGQQREHRGARPHHRCPRPRPGHRPRTQQRPSAPLGHRTARLRSRSGGLADHVGLRHPGTAHGEPAALRPRVRARPAWRRQRRAAGAHPGGHLPAHGLADRLLRRRRLHERRVAGLKPATGRPCSGLRPTDRVARRRVRRPDGT